MQNKQQYHPTQCCSRKLCFLVSADQHLTVNLTVNLTVTHHGGAAGDAGQQTMPCRARPCPCHTCHTAGVPCPYTAGEAI